MTKFTKKYFLQPFFNILREPLQVVSTETNYNLEEMSDTQLLGAGKSKGVELLGGPHDYLLQKAYFVNFFKRARRVFDFLPSTTSLGG